MRAILKLEAIGDNFDAYCRTGSRIAKAAGVDLGYTSSRPWVAQILGRDEKYTFARKFQRSQTDYSEANSVGSRGVYLFFFLESGVYEVFEHLSWKRSRRYFIRVYEAQITEVSREEVEAWLDHNGGEQ